MATVRLLSLAARSSFQMSVLQQEWVPRASTVTENPERIPIGNQTEVRFTFTEPLHGVVAVSQVGAKMKKFMAIYMASGADFENMMRNSTPEQRNKGMEAWMKWMNDNPVLHSGGRCPTGQNKAGGCHRCFRYEEQHRRLLYRASRDARRGSETVQQGSPTSSNAGCMGGNSRNYAAAVDVR